MGTCHSSDNKLAFSNLGNGLLVQKLSDEDIKLIKKSWNVIENNKEFGLCVMIR